MTDDIDDETLLVTLVGEEGQHRRMLTKRFRADERWKDIKYSTFDRRVEGNCR